MNYLTFALEIAQVLFLVTVQRCWIDAAYHQLRQPVDEYVFNIRAVEECFPMVVMTVFDLDLCTIGYTFPELTLSGVR
jgi:hypothetical protein